MNQAAKIVGGLLIAAAAGCQQPTSQPEPSSVGRYQLSQDQKYVYITDTSTGKVWYRSVLTRDDNHWTPLGTPATTQP